MSEGEVDRPDAQRDVLERDLMADIARRYYLAEESKVDIARSLGLDRFKVARLLRRARDEGIVRVSVATTRAVDVALSDRLADRLGLRRCLVVDTTGNDEDGRRQIAAAAAGVLPGIVREDDVLGLCWSRTVEALVDSLSNLPRCTVVQMAGSVSSTGGGLDLVQRTARLAGGLGHAVHAPLVVDDPGVAAALLRQGGISHTLHLADTLDAVIFSIGAWRAGCSTVWDVVSPSVRDGGLKAGAVCEVTGRLLDADGSSVRTPLDDLLIGATLEQLRRPAERIAFVNGPHKARATIAAVHGGLVTSLVATSHVARAVLQVTEAGKLDA